MDTNNHTELGAWVGERMARLMPNENWQPNVPMGLARLHELQTAKSWFLRRWSLVGAVAVAVCLFLVVMRSPQALAHKCVECSVAVWETIAAAGSRSAQMSVKTEGGRKMAPDFELKDAEGRDLRLSSLKGKVVLVNFWATWCEGCQVEIPWFVEFEKKYAGQGLAVVGVSMDADGWKSVRPWLKEKKVNYSIVIGDNELGKQYGLEGMPLTLLIDREGKIADAHSGIVKKLGTEKKIRMLLEEVYKSDSQR